ncbi:MAG: hypothetical protein JWQ21_1455 [Herminiimonas sp.]|nr:hypothetical protein [Herminiimonas sp.]
MTSKAKKAALAKVASGANVLQITEEKDKTRERLLAEVGFSPCGASANTARTYALDFAGELHITDAIAVMQTKVARVQRGDLSEVEATLAAQAVALDAIFNGLAKRAAQNMGQYMGATETYLRLALKAQAQCRATLETLAEVKYPKAPTFVRQQNVAYQQQVNNGSATDDSETSTRTHAHEKSVNQSNELLETQHGERLVSRTAGSASGNDSTLEAVGVVNGAADSGRKGA